MIFSASWQKKQVAIRIFYFCHKRTTGLIFFCVVYWVSPSQTPKLHRRETMKINKPSLIFTTLLSTIAHAEMEPYYICTPCPKGTYSKDQDCTACPSCSYTDSIASLSCKNCCIDHATACNNITGEPTACGNGYILRNKKCIKPCSSGYYMNNSGSCSECPD